jgi:hypothetical protein
LFFLQQAINKSKFVLNNIQQHAIADLTALYNKFIGDAIKQLPAKKDSEDKTKNTASVSVSAAAIEADFVANLTKCFTDLKSDTSIGMPGSEPSLFGNLSLVDNDQLEENIVIDSMVTRANTANENHLRNLNQGFKELMSPASFDEADNPISPRHIVNSFTDAVSNTELAMNQRLSLYRAFDVAVVQQFGSFYQSVNALLKGQGLLSDLPTKPVIKKSESSAHSETRPNAATAEAEILVEPESSIDNAAVVATLRDLLARSAGSQPGASDPGGVASGISLSETPDGIMKPVQMPTVEQPDLLQALSSLQQTNSEIASIKDAQQQILQIKDQLHADIESLHSDERRILGHENESIIDIVSMLFNFIFDDHSLPDEFKVLLGRLQIPIIKVALVDADFLDNTQHPARRLINTMAKACVGWTPDSGIGLKDKVAEIVNRVITEYKDDSLLFDELKQDFIRFYEEQQKRAVLLERRLKEAEVGKAQQEEARLLAEEALQQIEAGYGLPEDIKTFLDNDWQRLLAMIILREGHNSDDWQFYVQTGHDLIQSLHPVTSQSEIAIHKLQVVELLVNLRKGLDIIGYDDFEIENLEQMLKVHHEKVRQGEEVFLSKPSVDDEKAETVPEESIQQATEQASVSPEETLLDEELELSDDLVLGVPVVETFKDEQQDIEIAESFDSIVFDDDVIEIDIDDMPDPVVDTELTQDVETVIEEPQQDNLEQYLSIVKTLQAGCWFTYMDGETELRCKLAAVLPTVGKYIFVNNTGRKVSEYRTEELARALRDKAITQIDDSALFERALKNIVTTFQERRQREELE